MPIVRVTQHAMTQAVGLAGPCADGGAGALRDRLTAVLAETDRDGPVTVLLHGYRYCPGTPRSDPHRLLFAESPARRTRRVVSWPRHLGFGAPRSGHGLCIAFAWPARGSLWQAAARAEGAAAALAGLVAEVGTLAPGRRIDIVAHSLGARVALGAVGRVEAGRIGRVILLAGAEYRSRARAALATPGGALAEVFNITSRENDVFDRLFEALIPAPERGDRALGRGIAGHDSAGHDGAGHDGAGHDGAGHDGACPANWLDIPIGDGQVLAALRTLGFRIAPPAAHVCHWSAYLRPGAFPFYRRLIWNRTALPLPMLRAALPAAQAASAGPIGPGLPPRLGISPASSPGAERAA